MKKNVFKILNILLFSVFLFNTKTSCMLKPPILTPNEGESPMSPRIIRQRRGSLRPPNNENPNAAIIFFDMCNSTKIITSNSTESFDLMNKYIRYIQQATNAFSGKYIKSTGDGALTVFDGEINNIPIYYDESTRCNNAVNSALKLIEITQDFYFHGKQIKSRIGIDFGSVQFGFLGAETRCDYDVIGRPAATASKAGNHCKKVNFAILITEEVYNHLSDDLQNEFTDLGIQDLEFDKIHLYGAKPQQYTHSCQLDAIPEDDEDYEQEDYKEIIVQLNNATITF